LPDAKVQTVEVSERFWQSMTQVPAVRNGRVRTITDGYALVPGSRLGELARKMAEGLRPPPAADRERALKQETNR
jgi:ABC-type hemin transport system substrate-binding protein